jgi:hypothetical protein
MLLFYTVFLKEVTIRHPIAVIMISLTATPRGSMILLRTSRIILEATTSLLRMVIDAAVTRVRVVFRLTRYTNGIRYFSMTSQCEGTPAVRSLTLWSPRFLLGDSRITSVGCRGYVVVGVDGSGRPLRVDLLTAGRFPCRRCWFYCSALTRSLTGQEGKFGGFGIDGWSFDDDHGPDIARIKHQFLDLFFNLLDDDIPGRGCGLIP